MARSTTPSSTRRRHWPGRRPGRSATCAATPTTAGTWSACWPSGPCTGPSRGRGARRDPDADRSPSQETTVVKKKVHVQATVNGQPTEFLCEPRQSLLEVLRDELRLTGTKEGCNNGNCGACNVLLDGRLVNACVVLAVEVQGKKITTIEGIAPRQG